MRVACSDQNWGVYSIVASAYEGIASVEDKPRQCSEAVKCSGRTPVVDSPVRILPIRPGSIAGIYSELGRW